VGFSPLAPDTRTGAATGVVLWQFMGGSRRSVRVLQGIMLACAASGIVGLGLHYIGNREFELETYPDMGGWTLFREVMTGATPALAPAAMIHLGLLGLLYTFRHPLLARDGQVPPSTTES
jgi:hypothetical protein